MSAGPQTRYEDPRTGISLKDLRAPAEDLEAIERHAQLEARPPGTNLLSQMTLNHRLHGL